MLKKLLFNSLLIAVISTFGLSAMAQSEETAPVRKSTLAATDLPTGALKIKAGYVPSEIKQTLSKLVAAGGDKVRQGGSEVIIWTNGSYKKSSSAQMTVKLETALQNSGWTYEIGERNNEFVLFSLFREAPTRRALVGFFVPSDDAYIFALTEMLPANAPAAEAEDQIEEEQPSNNRNGRETSVGSGNSSSVIGKWWRGEGGGSIDYTGKTQYKSGRTYTFEFFADGTVEYVYELDVLSIIQCRTKESNKARGKYSVSGDTLTINLSAGTSVGSSSCEAKGNFKKTMPAENLTVKFRAKKMDSITRPDNPTMLCFDGKDGETCFEQTGK